LLHLVGIISLSHLNVQNQTYLQLVAQLVAKECRKVVHELYAPNEIRQEFLFVAMTCVVGSLAFKYVTKI